MSKVALVTDLKVVDSPQAGLGVARCLKDAGFDIIGVDDTPLITTNPELFKKVFCWEEIRTLNFDSLIRKVADVKKIYGLDYIFPCYDETVILFSFIKDKLDFLGIKLIAPSTATLKAIQKINLQGLIRGLNKYKTPTSKLIKSVDEGIKFAKTISYPVVCKGVIKGAYICENEGELEQNIKRLAKIWNNGEINCLIQKYISGKHKNCAVAIKKNKIVGYAEMEKIGRDQNGATWFGEINTSRELFELAEYIVNSLSFNTSLIEIETIQDGENYFLCEINPRSPAWIYAVSKLGLNLPDMVTKKFGKKIKFIKKDGYFGRETQHFIRKDIDDFADNLVFYSKAAAYKNKNLKYPSELLQIAVTNRDLEDSKSEEEIKLKNK